MQSKIKYIHAENNENDFQGYLDLLKVFDEYYASINVGKHYIRVPFESQSVIVHKKDFNERFSDNKYFTLFAKDGPNYIGSLEGEISNMYQSYEAGQVGYISWINVLPQYQRQSVGEKMKDLFFDWLKERNINFCQIDVKVENENAINVYKKWGFETDQIRMWKKI